MKIILFGIVVLFCIASYFDIKYRIIPNIVSFGTIILGLCYNIMRNGVTGFKVSILGMIIGFIFFLVLYTFKIMGAGDVKLSAGAGSLLGIKIVPALVVIVFVGGLIALIQIINFLVKKQINSNKVSEKIKDNKEMLKQSVPYGLAISIGTILTLIIN